MAEITVKSLKEVREQQILESAAQQQRKLRTQQIAQEGKVRREASKVSRRKDLPGYGQAFGVKVTEQKGAVEEKIGEAFEAQAKAIKAAAKKAIKEGVGIAGLEQKVVVLPNGEYVNKEWFDTLKPEEQSEISEKGLAGDNYTHFQKIGSKGNLVATRLLEDAEIVGDGEIVSKDWFATLKPDEQSELKEKGLQAGEYKYFEQIGPNREVIPKTAFENLVNKDLYKWLLSQEYNYACGISSSYLLDALKSDPSYIPGESYVDFVARTGKNPVVEKFRRDPLYVQGESVLKQLAELAQKTFLESVEKGGYITATQWSPEQQTIIDENYKALARMVLSEQPILTLIDKYAPDKLNDFYENKNVKEYVQNKVIAMIGQYRASGGGLGQPLATITAAGVAAKGYFTPTGSFGPTGGVPEAPSNYALIGGGLTPISAISVTSGWAGGQSPAINIPQGMISDGFDMIVGSLAKKENEAQQSMLRQLGVKGYQDFYSRWYEAEMSKPEYNLFKTSTGQFVPAEYYKELKKEEKVGLMWIVSGTGGMAAVEPTPVDWGDLLDTSEVKWYDQPGPGLPLQAPLGSGLEPGWQGGASVAQCLIAMAQPWRFALKSIVDNLGVDVADAISRRMTDFQYGQAVSTVGVEEEESAAIAGVGGAEVSGGKHTEGIEAARTQAGSAAQDDPLKLADDELLANYGDLIDKLSVFKKSMAGVASSMSAEDRKALANEILDIIQNKRKSGGSGVVAYIPSEPWLTPKTETIPLAKDWSLRQKVASKQKARRYTGVASNRMPSTTPSVRLLRGR
jgi:hypothetical protein